MKSCEQRTTWDRQGASHDGECQSGAILSLDVQEMGISMTAIGPTQLIKRYDEGMERGREGCTAPTLPERRVHLMPY